MSKVKKFLDSQYYIPIVSIISFIFWLIAFLSKNKWDDGYIYTNIENISLIVYGVVAAILLVLFKNTFYFIPLIIFIPFVFARPFDALTIPSCIFIGLGIMVVGLIIHIIIYKPKLNCGKFFWGLLVLCCAFVLGGINIKSENYMLQLFLTIICVIAFLSLYCLIASSSEAKIYEVARLFTFLGVYLSLQVAIYFIYSDTATLTLLLAKKVDVGWGISNNVALMLLFTFPFTFYLAIVNKGFKTIIYTVVALTQIIFILLTYSRGAIISSIIGFVCLIPFMIIKAKDKISFLSTFIVTIIIIASIIYAFSMKRPEEFLKILDILDDVNFDGFNGRSPIYKECIEVLKNNPIFGGGILSGFEENAAGDVVYEWGHSTILQTARSMGLVGCLAMIIHLIQKYFVLLKKPSVWKIMVVASFAISGLYGLFDVSYYFINYMIPLILGMAMLEFEFNNGEENYELV